ncbi:hypothetical protein NLU13_6638 [Sarocladium strictum]|uniref:Uncharacterized protein n=1 Tax=Sarocladium strictum TaxID=5046 RepID=A0AA39GIQ6_SARSR|nr:hypothetical protein NLU13_6638 [Sarocladium strictum]
MSSQSVAPLSRSPHLTKMLSDFTLGFSDGLTVPFALTAGLSSLGSSSTVIYAGLAELCAGSISMGIGGYLAALDELPCRPQEEVEDGTARDLARSRRGGNGERGGGVGGEESQHMLHRVSSDAGSSRVSAEEKREGDDQEDQVRRFLEPLNLSENAVSSVIADLRLQPGGFPRIIPGKAYDIASSEAVSPPVRPVVSGLAISAGYVFGGIIPLIPYFFAPTVGVGLRWSIALCLLALYLFGSGKCWLLSPQGASNWKECVFKGLQMLILGGLAAAAAVACVKLLDSGS